MPGEDIGSLADAGAVNTLYATPYNAVGHELWHQNASGIGGVAEAGDRFGKAVVSADFNDDGFDDLAIGAPEEDVGSQRDAGAVHVLFGSSSGLRGSGSQLLTRSPEPNDLFGASLAAAALDADLFGDLVVGAPGESVGTVRGAGAVNVFRGSRPGTALTPTRMFHENSSGSRDLLNSRMDSVARSASETTTATAISM